MHLLKIRLGWGKGCRNVGSHSHCIMFSPLSRLSSGNWVPRTSWRLVGRPVRTGRVARLHLPAVPDAARSQRLWGEGGGFGGHQASARGFCSFAGFEMELPRGAGSPLDRGIWLFKAPGYPQQVASRGPRWAIPTHPCPGCWVKRAGEREKATGYPDCSSKTWGSGEQWWGGRREPGDLPWRRGARHFGGREGEERGKRGQRCEGGPRWKAQGRGGGKRAGAIPPCEKVANPKKADTGFLTPARHARAPSEGPLRSAPCHSRPPPAGAG